ncbi:MAG: hypothetical protein V9F01_02445 [Chitinophagaceae bacterium]
MRKKGITSFKTFMAYKGALMIDDRQMVGLMQEVKKHGGLINVHATNGDMIDYLIAKHRAEGKLSPLYHYLSQPEVTEAEASRTVCRYGQLYRLSRLYSTSYLRRGIECRSQCNKKKPESICRNLYSVFDHSMQVYMNRILKALNG